MKVFKMPGETKHINSIEDAARLLNVKAYHPYVLIADVCRQDYVMEQPYHYGIYGFLLKMTGGPEFRYGLTPMSHQAGSVLFYAPGQVVCPMTKNPVRQSSLAVFIDQRFIRGTSLGKMIMQYKFFHYEYAEALFLSDAERDEYRTSMLQLAQELRQYGERLNPLYIIHQLREVLDLCATAYKRNYKHLLPENRDMLATFEHDVMLYLLSNRARTEGLPTLAYFASQYGMSKSYFGEIIKSYIGITPKQYITNEWTECAQEMLLDTSHSVERISNDLGFRSYNHFSYFFKKNVGMSPQTYRQDRRSYLEELRHHDKILTQDSHWNEKERNT